MYALVNWVIVGYGKGITWTNADILSIRPLETNFNEIRMKIHNFPFTKMHLKYHLQNGGHFVQGEMS